jgi:adenylate cyclase
MRFFPIHIFAVSYAYIAMDGSARVLENLNEDEAGSEKELRRLAAIMFTDMVGYTLAAENDESKAMRFLDEQRKIVRSQLTRYDGREVKTIGDAFLVEFASSLAAVQCAAAIQESIHGRNANRPPDEQIHLRVGLHLGEVLERKGDLYGDAVNVASRIEPLAPPDGVCVSRQVYENVNNKSDFGFERLGRRELKNVPAPLEVYRLVMNWEGSKGQTKTGALPADRVAVLPFVNISPNPEDEYFADGLTEELITKLSQVSGLKVIARTSVMNYKKQQKNASEIGSELGVGTLVEGSVRKSGGRIRVSVQVIDSNTEEHKWATTYDRNLDDIFAVQTEIAAKVTESLPGSILHASKPLDLGGTKNVEAYTAYMRARQIFQEGREESARSALELFKQSVQLDPGFARGWVGLAGCYANMGSHGFLSRKETKPKAEEALAKAFEISPDLPEAHAAKGLFGWFEDDFVTAEAEDKKAIELNPNLADAYASLALLKSSMGALGESIKLLEKVRELDPLSPMVPFLGELYSYAGRDEEALEIWAKMERFDPVNTCARLYVYEAERGRFDKAREYLERVERLAPGLVGIVGGRGLVAALAGDEKQAREMIKKLQDSYEDVGVMPNYVAYIYYVLGDVDAAFAWLGKAVKSHSLIPHVLRYSSLFEGLRKDPRYRQLLIANGLNPDNAD